MCNQCNVLQIKKEDDCLLDNDKWTIFKSGLVVWNKHSGLVDCENCLLWIQLKCREYFGKKCKYDFDWNECKEHFYFHVIGG